MTQYSPYAATGAGHNHLSEPPFAHFHSRGLPESEARPQPCEVAAAGLSCCRLTETEEGVALNGTLPQVFAALGAGQLEHKSMLLLPTLHRNTTAKRCETTYVCVCV